MAHGSLSQFKADLARKKAREDKRNTNFGNYGTLDTRQRKKTEYDFPDLTNAELQEVKQKIREKIKAQRRTRLQIRITLFVTLIACVILLFWYLKQ